MPNHSITASVYIHYIYEVCPEDIQPCNMKNRDIYCRKYKIQETLCIGQWCFSPLQSGHLGTSHSSPSQHQVAPLYFLESHGWSKISSLSKVILVLGKARSRRAPNLGCRGAESPGWFDVSPKHSAWDMMHEQASCPNEAANHQLPIAVAFWILWIVSVEECSSFTQNLMQVHCCTRSFWMRRPHSTHGHSDIYCPHWLVQSNRHCSHMPIPVRSPWLPGYTDVAQTILVILTMVGFFPNRPRILFIQKNVVGWWMCA